MKYLTDIRAALAASGAFEAVEIIAFPDLALTRAPDIGQDAEDPAAWVAAFVGESEMDAREDITVDIIIATPGGADATAAEGLARQYAARKAVKAAVHFQDFGNDEFYFEPAHRVGGHNMGGDANGILYWNEQYQLRTSYHEE